MNNAIKLPDWEMSACKGSNLEALDVNEISHNFPTWKKKRIEQVDT